jgi:predicted DNA-binding transcriptional regulator YafY
MDNKKVILLYILDILKEYSNKDYLLTQKDIINKLKLIYDISVDRKMIAYNIEILIDYGYDIVKGSKGGYYLNEREFDESEIKFLVDALFSSNVITSNNAHSIIKKLYSSLSKYDRKDFTYVYKVKDVNRTKNNNVFLNIELINEAIKNNKQIAFNYLQYNQEGKLIKRKDGYKYKVSPYYLINNYGKYYLLSNIEKYSTPSYFRIEHMVEVELIDKKRKDIKDTTLGNNFNISSHINDHVYMFSSNVINAKIEILQDWAITYIYDWFSKNSKIITQDNKTYAYIKSDEDAFIYWFLQYQEYFKIIEPLETKEKIINILKEEPKITLYDVSIKINKSLRTVKNIVKKLEEEEIVIREGSKKTGSWKVLK